MQWDLCCIFLLQLLSRRDREKDVYWLMQIFDKFTIKTKLFDNVLKYFFKPGVNMHPEKLLMKLLAICEEHRNKQSHEGDARALYRCFEALEERKRCFSQEHWQYLMEHEERVLSGK